MTVPSQDGWVPLQLQKVSTGCLYPAEVAAGKPGAEWNLASCKSYAHDQSQAVVLQLMQGVPAKLLPSLFSWVISEIAWK